MLKNDTATAQTSDMQLVCLDLLLDYVFIALIITDK